MPDVDEGAVSPPAPMCLPPFARSQALAALTALPPTEFWRSAAAMYVAGDLTPEEIAPTTRANLLQTLVPILRRLARECGGTPPTWALAAQEDRESVLLAADIIAGRVDSSTLTPIARVRALAAMQGRYRTLYVHDPR